MSDTIYISNEFAICTFYGGPTRGQCLQITPRQLRAGGHYLQLTRAEATELVGEISMWLTGRAKPVEDDTMMTEREPQQSEEELADAICQKLKLGYSPGGFRYEFTRATILSEWQHGRSSPSDEAPQTRHESRT